MAQSFLRSDGNYRRTIPPQLALMFCLIMVSGCDPASAGKEVVVGGLANDHLCKGCIQSKRDNPLIKGTLTLDKTRGSTREFVESAERNNLGFLYGNFRIDAAVKGAPRLGAADLDLTPAPSAPGVWTASNAPPPTALPWELRGIELGYALSEAFIFRRGALGAQAAAPESPVKVQLDPTVMLVPIQVVRVIPSSPSAPYASQLAKFTKAVQKKYWDGRLDLDTFRVSEPGIPNVSAQHSVNSTSLPWESADEIWQQCGIQFRMITCPGSHEGCPDLVVTEEARIASASCIKGRSPDVSQNWSEAEELSGINKDLPIVTFAWRVARADCRQVALARPGRAAMGFAVTTGTDLALAHELGHVLGLDDFDSCLKNGSHLMCGDTAEIAPNIRPEDCTKARTAAARIVERHWGVKISP